MAVTWRHGLPPCDGWYLVKWEPGDDPVRVRIEMVPADRIGPRHAVWSRGDGDDPEAYPGDTPDAVWAPAPRDES